jgi:hypothetical protein
MELVILVYQEFTNEISVVRIYKLSALTSLLHTPQTILTTLPYLSHF